MKKLRLFVVAAIAAGSIVIGASPASANCTGEPVNPCVVVCQVAESNKYLEPVQRICHVW